MKKTFLFGLIAAALGFAACSSEDDAILSQKPQKGMMTLNATVQQSVDTRATLNVSASTWAFEFANGDELKVTNSELTSGTYYTFTKGATDFASTTATPTSSPATWYAYFPSNTVTLTGQSGTAADVANKYALVGTATSTTGSEGLDITMSAQVAILKIVNAGGSIDINVKNSATTWVTGLDASDGSFSVTTSTTKASLLSKTAAGTYYVAVPAGIALEVKDGDTRIKSTATGLFAGKYYTLTVGAVAWTNVLTLGKSAATSISIETGVTTKPTSGTEDLNSDGTLWAVLDGTTLKIQTAAQKIKGFDDPSSGMFVGYKNVESISNLDKIDMSEVTSMNNMFYYCQKLKTLDLSSFNTENVTSMDNMFYYCYALTDLDLSSFNTANVTSMNKMFYECHKLTSLNLSSFNTEKVTSMTSMFYYCDLLPSLSLPTTFNTSNVTNMDRMFQYCYALTSLDLRNFNTEKVTSMQYMFNSCSALTELDLSSFNTTAVTDMSQMFNLSKKLKSLKLSDNFIIGSTTNTVNMFCSCGQDATSIGSGQGVIYGVTVDAIKDACKASTNWSYTFMKFDGE